MARPTLRIANIPTLTRGINNNDDGTDDEDTLINILEDESIYKNEDMLNTSVTYRRTLYANVFDSTDSAPSSPPVELSISNLYN